MATKKSNARTNGNTGNSERIEQMRLATLADDYFQRLIFGTPNLDRLQSETPTQDTGNATNYSKAVLLQLAASFSDYTQLIETLEKKRKDWSEGARLSFAPFVEQFATWAESLVPDTALDFTSGNDRLHLSSAKVAIRQTALAWLDNLAKLSNNAIRGRKAEADKAAKAGMMDDPKKGKTLKGFSVSNTEDVKGKASVSFCVEDTDGLLRAFILEICEVVDLFDRDQRVDAVQIIERLTGNSNEDKRFAFDADLVFAFIQGRLFGKLASNASQQIKEAQQQKDAYLKSIAVSAADEARLEEIRRATERQKEKQAGEVSNPDSASNQQVRPMTGITSRSIVERKAKDAGHLVDLTDDDIESIVAKLDAGEITREQIIGQINTIIYAKNVAEDSAEELATA